MRKSFPFSGAPHYEWNVKQVKTNTGENISTSPQRIILHCSKWIWIPLASDKTASRFSFAMCWHGTCGDVCNLAFRHSCCWIWRTYEWHNKMKKKPCFGPCGLYFRLTIELDHWVKDETCLCKSHQGVALWFLWCSECFFFSVAVQVQYFWALWNVTAHLSLNKPHNLRYDSCPHHKQWGMSYRPNPTWSMSNSYSYQAPLINKNQGHSILERVRSWFSGMTMISIFSFMQVRKGFVSCQKTQPTFAGDYMRWALSSMGTMTPLLYPWCSTC